jgi:hypothetical protein
LFSLSGEKAGLEAVGFGRIRVHEMLPEVLRAEKKVLRVRQKTQDCEPWKRPKETIVCGVQYEEIAAREAAKSFDNRL